MPRVNIFCDAKNQRCDSKTFIDDRNSFIIEERKSLGLYQTANANEDEHQIISPYNDEVKTDSLDMIMSKTQGNDQVIFNATNAQNMPHTIQLASREQS